MGTMHHLAGQGQRFMGIVSPDAGPRAAQHGNRGQPIPQAHVTHRVGDVHRFNNWQPIGLTAQQTAFSAKLGNFGAAMCIARGDQQQRGWMLLAQDVMRLKSQRFL